jgi:hypothetical protein
MARNDETRVREFPMFFQVDPSWYERHWLQQPAPRKPGIFAFFRRILSQQRLTRRQDAQSASPQLRQTPNDSFASVSERSCTADIARAPARLWVG